MTWLRSTALLQGIELPDNGRANACPLSPTSATTCNASNVPVVAQRRSLLPQAAPGGVRGVSSSPSASDTSRGGGGGRGGGRKGGGDVRDGPGAVPASGDAVVVGGGAGGGGWAGKGAAFVIITAIVIVPVAITVIPAAARFMNTPSIIEGTVIAAMLITPLFLPSPFTRGPRWPFVDSFLPLPRPLGSTPSVLVEVADGNVVVPTPLSDDTRGGVDGISGFRDEPRATACARTTREATPSVNATTSLPVTVVIVLIPAASIPPVNAGDGDCDSG